MWCGRGRSYVSRAYHPPGASPWPCIGHSRCPRAGRRAWRRRTVPGLPTRRRRCTQRGRHRRTEALHRAAERHRIAARRSARGIHGAAGARSDAICVFCDELVAGLGPVGRETDARLCAKLLQPRLLDNGEWRHAAMVSSGAAIVRRRGGSPGPAPAGGSRTGAPSNTRRSGAYTMRSTIERSSSWPPAPTMSQPKPANQHRSCRVRRKRSTSAPSCACR